MLGVCWQSALVRKKNSALVYEQQEAWEGDARANLAGAGELLTVGWPTAVRRTWGSPFWWLELYAHRDMEFFVLVRGWRIWLCKRI